MDDSIYNIVVEARLGDSSAQEKTLKYLNDLTYAVNKQYKGFFDGNYGMNKQFFEIILLECFQNVLYSDNLYKIDEFDKVFKYIYIQKIKYHIRRYFNNWEFNSKSEDIYNEKINNDFIGDSSNHDGKYKCPDEIVTTIIRDPNSKIKEKEIKVLDLYLKDYTISEISRILNESYVAVSKQLERALLKCKKYIKENFGDFC